MPSIDLACCVGPRSAAPESCRSRCKVRSQTRCKASYRSFARDLSQDALQAVADREFDVGYAFASTGTRR
jgi:hypothetical protein